MSLQFIFGNSGAGKSQYLYHYIIKESMEHPKTNYLVIVPEQFTMQTQKDLCMAHPRHGIMNIDVLSFARLSHRIFEETGRGTKMILDDEGKNLIIRKIAGQYEDDLKVLKGNLKKQGYISEVKSVISEFTQYGIGFDELDGFLETLDSECYLSYKLQDIRKVYEGFESYLADRYITKEELLDVLSEAVPESQILKDSVVVLDGFTGFTPVQNRLLGELMKVCSKVLLTVEMDQREDPFSYQHPYQLFAMSKQMVTSLVKIAGENRVTVDNSIFLYEKPVARFRKNPMMGFLEEELFRYSGNKYERNDAKEEQSISIHVTKTPREEAEFVAASIRKIVREKNYRYRDIGVIVSDMNTYADYLEKQCADYEIPIFMDHKKSILLNAYVEYVRSLLTMIEQNFSYPSVFRFLRTGMSGFTREEVDRLENYVIALGIRGYKKWQSAWVRRTAEVGEESLAQLNHLRVQFVEKIDGLVTILKKRSKTVKDVTLAVYDFLCQEKLQEKIEKTEQQFQEAGELALAKEYSQIYRILMDLFDKFVELLGEEKISLKEYCELLDAGLEEAKVGVIPPSLDQVVIGDVQRTRLNHLKVLFFVGANDVFIPGKLGQSGLLSERDREQFTNRNIALSPGTKEKTYIQKFYLYLNLTKPSEQLILSFSKVSGDGKSLRPAYVIQDLQRMFPGLVVEDEEKRSLLERELTWKRGEKELAAGIRDRVHGVSDEWKELYTWYRNHVVDSKDVNRFLDAAFYRKKKEQLSEKTAQELYGDLSRTSVTRLERFANCAYAHFLSYGLRLSEREQYTFEAMDLGNLAHQAMERFAGKLESLQLDWAKVSIELQEQLIEESVEESILDYGNTVLYSSARNEYMITRLKQLIRRSVWALTKQVEGGDFRPSRFEMKFGSGKIDRIDLCKEDGTIYVKVIDYKTGLKNFDLLSLYHGLQMQLPVYMNAALEVIRRAHPENEIVPAGIFYYKMRDPFVEKIKDDRELEAKLLDTLKLDGLINGETAVLNHLERNLSGSSVLHPFGYKKSGELMAASKVLSEDSFCEILEYTKEKEQELKQSMVSGKVAPEPYVLGSESGCDYCAFRDICGFDVTLDGYEYHNLEKYKSEEVIQMIHQHLKEKRNEKLDETGGEA